MERRTTTTAHAIAAPPEARRVWAEIHVDRLHRNVRRVRAAVGPQVAIMAVVKANGYGHGAVTAARTALAAGAARLAVSNLTEAAELRAAGLFAPVHILGALEHDELAEAVRLGVTPMVHGAFDATALAIHARKQGRRVPVHLLIDTGMARLGAGMARVSEVARTVGGEASLDFEGVATHMACADHPDAAFTEAQIANFNAMLERLAREGYAPRLRHAAASAALFRFPGARYDLVRPGLSLYGLDPCDLRLQGVDLEPVLELRARIVHLKEVGPGTPVGYGASYVTRDRTRLAMVAAGYADGVPFGLSGREGAVLLRGRRCPILGRVTMDYTTIDVTAVPGAAVGDIATLIGRDGEVEITVEEVAARAGTIPYAVTCGLGSRVQRISRGRANDAEEPAAFAQSAERRTALVNTALPEPRRLAARERAPSRDRARVLAPTMPLRPSATARHPHPTTPLRQAGG